MYMSSFAALIFSILLHNKFYTFIKNDEYNHTRCLVMLVIAVVCGCAGFRGDKSFERYETLLLKSLPDFKLKEYAMKFGLSKV